MKILEVLTPPPAEIITEGYTFTQDEDGKYTLDYDSSTPGQDDVIMKKRMSGLRSKKTAGRLKLETPRGVGTDNFDVFSWKEREEFQPHRDDETFQAKIPTFYGMSLDAGKQRTEGREHYNRILDALKGRNGHHTTPEAMDSMMRRSAQSVMKQMEAYYRDIERTDNVVIIPIPSSSSIPAAFAQALADEMGARGKVANVNDIIEQNLNYKMGVAGGKNMDPDKLVNLYQNILDEYRTGARSEDQVLAFIDDAQEFLEKQLNNPDISDQDKKLYQVDYKFLKQAEEQFYDIAGEDVTDAAKQRTVHSMFGGVRRHVYDRVKLRKDAKRPQHTAKTIYVLADDNVDQGRTIVDVYRYLYKKGLFNQPGAKVIGAVMHKLGADNKR